MAVIIEFISVLVPVRAIEERFHGGIKGFHEVFGEPPTDGRLMRMGAMNQIEILCIVQALVRGGLKGTFRKGGLECWLDFCVVDSCSGPTLPCEWIEVDLEQGLAELEWKPARKG